MTTVLYGAQRTKASSCGPFVFSGGQLCGIATILTAGNINRRLMLITPASTAVRMGLFVIRDSCGSIRSRSKDAH